MQNKEKEIEVWRSHYASLPDAKLIQEMHQWDSPAPQHIAAKQLLNERARAEQDRMHAQSMAEIVKANRLSFIILIVALLTLLVALADFSWNRFLPTSNTNSNTEPEKPKKELNKPAVVGAPESNITPSMREKQKSKTVTTK